MRWITFLLMLICGGSVALADNADDCNQKTDHDLRIKACTALINANDQRAAAYNLRAYAYQAKSDYAQAIKDTTSSLAADPKDANVYGHRGLLYNHPNVREYVKAIADFTKAIELDPRKASYHHLRGSARRNNSEFDLAIADYSKALALDPKRSAGTWSGRCRAYLKKGDNERALADCKEAVRLSPDKVWTHINLGRVHVQMVRLELAIAEFTEAVRLPGDGSKLEAFAERAAIYERQGLNDLARADFAAVLALPASDEDEKRARTAAQLALARLDAVAQNARPRQPNPDSGPATATVPGRRVALVIGNSSYSHVERLANPLNDTRTVAAAFRRLGFTEVIEKADLGYMAMGVALREFGDRTADADWAVIYYAGHGIELNGVAHLIPIDARLERDTHVSDETIGLARVLEKVESAKKLRLVILDACRNNPFSARMIRSAGAARSIGRGLAQIEPEAGVLVAYSAKHGTIAEDGSGRLSPFAEAFVGMIEEPGLEIGFLFRRIRDRVLEKTNKRQEPYIYGTLPGESLYFAPPR